MQSLKPVKEGSRVKFLLCYACLTSDRKLFVLTNSAADYRKIWRKIVQGVGLDVSLCWECLALLRNVKKFQEKVKTAQTVLKQAAGDATNMKDLLNNHSNLSTTQPYIISCSGLVSLENEIVDKNIELEFKIKQEDDQIHDEFNIYDDLLDEFKEDIPSEIPLKEELENTVENSRKNEPENGLKEDTKNTIDVRSIDFINLKNEPLQEDKTSNTNKIELTLQKKGRKRKQLTKKKRKYKLEHVNVDHSLTRVAISPIEVNNWLEKERNSKYFKGVRNKCMQCAKRITSTNLKSHMRLHSKKLNFICDVCKRPYMQKKRLIQHINYHNYIWSCNMCEFKCVQREHMMKHLGNEHSRVVKCLGCDETFRSIKEFRFHFNLAHRVNNGNFSSDYCKKMFKQIRVLKKHIERYHLSQRCTDCGRTFPNLYRLNCHKKIMHHIDRSEATYCVQCDKQFDNKDLFTRHFSSYAVHAGERKQRKKATCPACGKVYAKSSNMKNHYNKEHVEVPRFRCVECDKSFVNNSKLKEHNKYVHQGFVKKRDKMCTYCGRGFTDLKILKQHIRRHTGERPYKCPHCGSTFAQRTAMVTHVKNIHNKKKLKQ